MVCFCSSYSLEITVQKRCVNAGSVHITMVAAVTFAASQKFWTSAIPQQTAQTSMGWVVALTCIGVVRYLWAAQNPDKAAMWGTCIPYSRCTPLLLLPCKSTLFPAPCAPIPPLVWVSVWSCHPLRQDSELLWGRSHFVPSFSWRVFPVKPSGDWQTVLTTGSNLCSSEGNHANMKEPNAGYNLWF